MFRVFNMKKKSKSRNRTKKKKMSLSSKIIGLGIIGLGIFYARKYVKWEIGGLKKREKKKIILKTPPKTMHTTISLPAKEDLGKSMLQPIVKEAAYTELPTKLPNGENLPKSPPNDLEYFIKYKMGRVLDAYKDDIMENMITIDANGTYSNDKFTVPNGIEIMIPHQLGNAFVYKIPELHRNNTANMYTQGFFNFDHDWRLYQPGEIINDMLFKKSFGSCTREKEFEENRSSLQQELIDKSTSIISAHNWLPLYVTAHVGYQHQAVRSPSGGIKIKIKACGDVKMSDLVLNLKQTLQKIQNEVDRPMSPKYDANIIFVPITSNADPKDTSNGPTLKVTDDPVKLKNSDLVFFSERSLQQVYNRLKDDV